MFNIFYRKRGLKYQWGGTPTYDSGCIEHRFASRDEALAYAKAADKAKEDAIKAEIETVCKRINTARAWALDILLRGIKSSLTVPGSFRELDRTAVIFNKGKNILVAYDYTAQNAFGVPIRQCTAAVFDSTGKKFIREATADDLKYTYPYGY